MAEFNKAFNLPTPEKDDVKQQQLYRELNNIVRSIGSVLDRGVSFSENVDCDLVTFTSNATPDTEDATAHSLGKAPSGYIVYSRDKAGVLYDSGTAFTSSNIYTKCNVASVAFKLIVF